MSEATLVAIATANFRCLNCGREFQIVVTPDQPTPVECACGNHKHTMFTGQEWAFAPKEGPQTYDPDAPR